MLPLPGKDNGKEERRAQQGGDRAYREGRAIAEAAGERVGQQQKQAPAQHRGRNGNTVILPEKLLCYMRADNADKADDAEEGDTDRRNDRSQKHGHKAKTIHRHAHAFCSRVPAEQGVKLPAHHHEKHGADQYHGRHDAVRAIGGAAEVAEGPDHGGREADVGGIELQNGGGRCPDRAEGNTGQHHHTRLKGPQTAEAEDQQNGNRGEEKRHQRGGVGIGTHGVARQVVPRIQKSACEGNDGEICAEHGSVGNTQRGRGGHRVVQIGLHDETGYGQPRSGNDCRQNTRDPDVPDDAHLCRTAFLYERRKAFRYGHMRRTDKQAYKGKYQHCRGEQNKRRPVPSSVFSSSFSPPCIRFSRY